MSAVPHTGPEPYVFVSYPREDIDLVREELDRLADAREGPDKGVVDLNREFGLDPRGALRGPGELLAGQEGVHVLA